MIKSILQILSYTSALFYVSVFLYLFRGWLKISPFSRKKEAVFSTTVAVIIAARNEGNQIRRTIDAVLAQNYPKHLSQFIFIDDHSTDNTAEVIRSYEHLGIQLIQLNENKALNSYKKKAIATAIEKTDAKLIITTDADCWMSKHWLQQIVAFYEAGNYKMISAPVLYANEQSFFETLQSLEFMTLIGLGAATIGNGASATCNGANLAYERESFLAVGGFKGIDDLASGDDELLLHKISAQYPGSIGFVKNKEAVVYTEAKPDLYSFIQQRRRWASKSTKYKNKGMVFLGVSIWIFNATILLNILLSLWNIQFLEVFAWQILIKVSVELLFLTPISHFAGRKKLLYLQPVLSLPHIIYMVCIGILGNSGTYQWKGREVR